MAKRSTATNRRLAQEIFKEYGDRIFQAVHGTSVPDSFLAGLISVEAGRTKTGAINPNASRFEGHVFQRLQDLQQGKRVAYNGISRAQIRDATPDALRALSHSYGVTQIMGWHCINNLKCTVGELRDPDKHLGYAVKLLTIVGSDDFREGTSDAVYERVYREWNSGRETGKTHDPAYVSNALGVAREYEKIAGSVVQVTSEPPPVNATPSTSVVGTKDNEGAVKTLDAAPSTPEPKAEESPVTIQKVAQSLGSKVIAGGTVSAGVMGTVGAALLGILKNPYTLAGLLVVVAVGIWAWNESKKRQHAVQVALINAGADKNKNTVEMQPPPAKAG